MLQCSKAPYLEGPSKAAVAGGVTGQAGALDRVHILEDCLLPTLQPPASGVRQAGRSRVAGVCIRPIAPALSHSRLSSLEADKLHTAALCIH
jgi:hypothetical protein